MIDLGTALRLHQGGDLAGAEAAYRSLIRVNPRTPAPVYYLGVLMLQRGDALGACRQFDAALGLGELPAEAHANRATALRQLGRTDEALASLDKALSLNPRLLAAIIARGNALLDLGRAADALQSFIHAQRVKPDDPEALNGAGLAHLALGDPKAALESLDRGLKVAPAAPWLLVNRAVALIEAGRAREGLEACDAAQTVAKGDPALAAARGNALFDLGRVDEALTAYDTVLAIDPHRARDWDSRGTCLMMLGRCELALDSFRRALTAHAAARQKLSDPLQTRFNLHTMLRELRRFDEAATVIDALYAEAPAYPFVRGAAFRAHLELCRWGGLEKDREDLLRAVGSGAPADQPWNFLSVSDDPQLQLECARCYVHERGFGSVQRGEPGDRPPRRTGPIRIAYLSADFREHATMYLAAGLFEAHDRTRFETTAISFARDDSPMHRRAQAAFDQFVDASGMSDAEVQQYLRNADIDLAIDLHGFTGGSRPQVLAMHPARLQVSFLGYPGSMGVDWIDYLIADDVVVPEDARAAYSEAIAYLPRCYQVNDSARVLPSATPARSALGLPEEGFVFASFGPAYKIAPPLFDAWMQILKAVPGSVLWLLENGAGASAALRDEARARGVDPARLCFAPRVPHAQFLTHLAAAGLFLDTFPVCAQTTASDALWAGLPILAIAGRAFASRVSASLLEGLGLGELVTSSFGEYVRLAIELAASPERLAAIRNALLSQGRRSPVFDSRSFCRDLESAYETMWLRHQAGLVPATFHVPGVGP